jgi:hypothetical protein
MPSQRLDQRPAFVEVRDPHTLKLVCRYNPATHEVETIGRDGTPRRARLPVDMERVKAYARLANIDSSER